MSIKTDYLEGKLVEHTLRNVAFTSPTAVFAALLTGVANAETAAVTEVSGGSYARQGVTFGAQVGGVCSNSVAVTFPTATANWGTATHVGIYDALGGGNALYILSLTSAQAINTGQTASFAAGALQIGET